MDDWNKRANDIFADALQIEDENARAEFISQACRDDSPLQEQVESLIAASPEADEFLDGLAAETQGLARPPRDSVGAVIGSFKLLQEIGEGGFGVVYMAQQAKPIRRKVALKIIKPGMDTKQVIARFEAERQALALMDHANIAKVIDAGTTNDGRPYFVMELVKGVPITDFCDENKLSPEGRLRLFMTVCSAVQHAHQKGVIHRDLKPSNVMVTMIDGEAITKVIDFGIAKAINQELTEKTLFTAYGQMIGTPEYMSPEQAKINALDVDTRSDVYSLGVLLYELITGSTPLDARRLRESGYDEMRRLIRELETPVPSRRLSTIGEQVHVIAGLRGVPRSQLLNSVRGELDWITMKCLEKDRNRRYDSPNDLVADIRRFLDNETVSAVAPSTLYKLSKLWSKHRVLAATAAVVAISLIATSIISVWSASVAGQKSKESEAAKQKAQSAENRLRDLTVQQRKDLYRTNIFAAAAAEQNDAVNSLRFLQACSNDQKGWEWHYLRTRNRIESTLSLPQRDVIWMATSPTEQKVAIYDSTRHIRLYDFDGNELWSEPMPIDDPFAMFFSANGERLVLGSHFSRSPGQVGVWEISSGRLIWTTNEDHHVGLPRLDPKGEKVAYPTYHFDATGEFRGAIVLRDLREDREIRLTRKPAGVEFSPNGERLFLNSMTASLSSHAQSTLSCLRLDGTEEWSIERPNTSFVTATPGGNTLVSGTHDQLQVRDAATGNVQESHDFNTWFSMFDPTGRYLLIEPRESEYVQILDWNTRSLIQEIQERLVIGQSGPEFTADGDRIITLTGNTPELHFRRTVPHQSPLILSGHEREVNHLCYAADGKRIYSITNTELRTWNAGTGQLLGVHSFGGRAVTCSSNGDLIATGGTEGLSVRKTNSWQLVQSWDDTDTSSIQFSGDNERILVGGDSGTISVHDVSSGAVIASVRTTGAIGGLTFLDTAGDRVAVLMRNEQRILIWDLATGELGKLFDGGPGLCRSVSVSPDGQLLAACMGRMVELWDLKAKTRLLVFDRHGHNPSSVLFNGSGRVFSADDDGVVKVWDASSGHELLTILTKHNTHGMAPYQVSLALSPDGKTLASTGGDGNIRLWQSDRPSIRLTRDRETVRKATALIRRRMKAAPSMSQLFQAIKQDEAIDQETRTVALEIAKAEAAAAKPGT